ncbi:MAG: hypothetical protein EBZ07_02905 [Verrucomicrobia bacterium]|nr:hypothetical protein [Verrucomicrobiota bacterium]
MTPRGRQSLAPRISLFYFLDIITAMSGIMILVSLYFATCLREGSPLFPGSSRWQSRDEEQDLQSSLLRLAGEKNRQTELQEKLRWSELTPREIRRKLRRLEAIGAEGGGGGEGQELTAEQILQRAGLASLRDKIRALELDVGKRRSEVAEARQTHENLDHQVRQLQESSANLLADKKGFRLVRDGRDTTKVPVIVEVSYPRIVLYPFDQPEARQVLEPATQSLQQLRRWFSVYQPETHYAFLLVQPSGYGLFTELREQLLRLGFEVGYDGVPEDPRMLMSDVTAPGSVGRPAVSIGDPEPWPVEGEGKTP